MISHCQEPGDLRQINSGPDLKVLGPSPEGSLEEPVEVVRRPGMSRGLCVGSAGPVGSWLLSSSVVSGLPPSGDSFGSVGSGLPSSGDSSSSVGPGLPSSGDSSSSVGSGLPSSGDSSSSVGSGLPSSGDSSGSVGSGLPSGDPSGPDRAWRSSSSSPPPVGSSGFGWSWPPSSSALGSVGSSDTGGPWPPSPLSVVPLRVAPESAVSSPCPDVSGTLLPDCADPDCRVMTRQIQAQTLDVILMTVTSDTIQLCWSHIVGGSGRAVFSRVVAIAMAQIRV